MYEDNAWPDTAPIQTFIPERKRPQRVVYATIAMYVALEAAIGGGLLHFAVAGAEGASFLVAVPGLVMFVLGALIAAWCGVLSVVVAKGRKWSREPALWTSVGLVVFYGIYGLLIKPGPEVDDEAFLLWLYAVQVFLAAAAGVVAGACLLGRRVAEYFDPPVAPNPFQHNAGQAPIGGNDADWIPPQQRGNQQPPFVS